MTDHGDRTVRPRPKRRLHLQAPMGRAKTKVICRDCGEECRIVPLGFKCACGFGLVCQWDACVARGVFLGRIQFPETSEVLT